MDKYKESYRRPPKDVLPSDVATIFNRHGNSPDMPRLTSTKYKSTENARCQTNLPREMNSNHVQNSRIENCNGSSVFYCLHCDNNQRVSQNHFTMAAQVKTKDSSHVEKVFAKFELPKDTLVSSHTLNLLKSPEFNSWNFDESEMLMFLQDMFSDLGLVREFHIEAAALQSWLKKIYLCYNDVPFHNFKHCFCVAQMTYALIHLMDLQSKMSPLDIFTLLFSAICHDLDHPGFNNTFQVNSLSRLALLYNDSSPLENHHCCTAFKVFTDSSTNILNKMEQPDYVYFRRAVIKCILATDLAKHDEIMTEFAEALKEFDYTKTQHKSLLMMMLIKVADISNEMRELECSTLWMKCLLKEYFNQSDVEKESGLPITPYMDRNRVNKSEMQVNFIKTFLLPSLKCLAQLEPKLNDNVIATVERNLAHYQAGSSMESN